MNKYKITHRNGQEFDIEAENFVIYSDSNKILFYNGRFYGTIPQSIKHLEFGRERESWVGTNIVAYIAKEDVVFLRKFEDK